jgi:hypothetical protein
MAVLAQAVLIWAFVRLMFAPHGPPAPGGYARPLETPAVVGKPFGSELILKNGGVSTMHIVSVKVPVGEKAPLRIAGPEPAPKEVTRVRDQETWRYDRSLAPRQELRIHFKATPTTPGKVSAELTVDSATPKTFSLEVKANAAVSGR